VVQRPLGGQGELGRRVVFGALPLLFLLALYDGLRYVLPVCVRPSRVLACGLREAELLLFGVRSGGAVLTPNEWLGLYASTPLDLICALPYGAYVPVMAGHYVYLLIKRPKEASVFARVAVGTHLLGFLTYLLLPAAPPWYVRAYGCGIDLAVRNSAGALERVDALLGFGYFRELYSHGTVAFGALPSLHVTYPLYGLFATFHRPGAISRAVQVVYALIMSFAAVYLGHHYVIDVLVGVFYAVCVFGVVLWWSGSPTRANERVWSISGYARRPVDRGRGISG